jgi:hypothetical protein
MALSCPPQVDLIHPCGKVNFSNCFATSLRMTHLLKTYIHSSISLDLSKMLQV